MYYTIVVTNINMDPYLHEMSLTKLPEDGPKCGSKHVAAIKWNQCKHFDWFISYCCASVV
jgi:hypothetical protein